MSSSVTQFYNGKSILITGCTGFMGKVLIEKLLRSCQDVSVIYLLVRTKKGKEPKQRLEDILKTPIFENLSSMPHAEALFKKLHCISGDVLQPNLDLSNDDLYLLQNNVDIVFHMAANVRFDQPLKTALYENTGGTLNVLNLVQTFKNLKAFVHVSTSFCHCDREELDEVVYKAPQNPRKMLDLVSWMDEDLIALLTPNLLKNAPNTYAYTKCLTEQLVTEFSQKIPVAIARPSIVICSWKEPMPGWIDNMNGPIGLLVAAGKGVVRTMHGNSNYTGDLVPVDLVINGLILIAKELAESQDTSGEPLVVNLTRGKDNEITWGEVVELAKKHFFQNPFSICLWYPGGGIQSNYFLHLLSVIFFHIIPAYFVDFLIFLMRGKPFLVRVQKRVQEGLKMLQYYTKRRWYFKNDKIKAICSRLSEKEKEIFNVDFGEMQWDSYMLNSVLGARQYCVKESPDTIPYARKVMKRLYYLDVAKNILLALLVFWFLYTWRFTIFGCTEQIMQHLTL